MKKETNTQEVLDELQTAFSQALEDGVGQIGKLFNTLKKELDDREQLVYTSPTRAKKRCNIPERLWLEMEPELPYVTAKADDGSLKKYYTVQGVSDYVDEHTVYPKLNRH